MVDGRLGPGVLNLHPGYEWESCGVRSAKPGQLSRQPLPGAWATFPPALVFPRGRKPGRKTPEGLSVEAPGREEARTCPEGQTHVPQARHGWPQSRGGTTQVQGPDPSPSQERLEARGLRPVQVLMPMWSGWGPARSSLVQ